MRRSKKRPSKKQLAARRKFAAMARARAKAAKKTTKRAKRKVNMAKRRKTTRRKSSTRRRRTSARRSPVTRLRRGAVYVTNPRGKRRRRRSYRRNPFGVRGGIVGDVIGLATDTGAVLVGRGAGRFIGNMIPVGGSPIIDFAKNTLVAIGIKRFGKRFVGDRVAGLAAIGAMLNPVSDLVNAYFPAAGALLSGHVMAMPSFPGAAPLHAYSGDSAEVMEDESLAAYAGGGEVWQ